MNSRFLLMAMALAGCAEAETWHKAGSSYADNQRDAYECERDTRTAAASFSGGVFGAGEAQAFYGRCMQARGYFLASSNATRGTAIAVTPSTELKDALGRIYAANDMVQCRFYEAQPLSRTIAQGCVNLRGRIEGPAS